MGKEQETHLFVLCANQGLFFSAAWCDLVLLQSERQCGLTQCSGNAKNLTINYLEWCQHGVGVIILYIWHVPSMASPPSKSMMTKLHLNN